MEFQREDCSLHNSNCTSHLLPQSPNHELKIKLIPFRDGERGRTLQQYSSPQYTAGAHKGTGEREEYSLQSVLRVRQ